MRRPAAGGVLAPSQYRSESQLFDREAVRRCAIQLLAARRPAILAGHGVNLAEAQPELLELAELLSIPVATTPKGKGAFPETHPLSLRVFGMASSPLSERYLLAEGADALLVLGSSLHENSTSGWDARLVPGLLMQQDIEPAMFGRNYPVSVALAGDAKTTLRELLFELRRRLARGEAPPDGAREAFARFKAGAPAYLDSTAMSSDAVPIRPQRLMRELDEAIPGDALIFLDVGNNTLWAAHYMSATGSNAFIHNWGEFAAMGYGVAAAVGGKLAAPRRPVIAVVGDGGFAMAGMEVSTAVTENVPVVWVVLNDSRLNAIYHGQTLIYAKRTIGCQFHRMDIAKIAEGLGAVGRRIVSPGEIGPALAEALASGRPTVLDVWIDADEVPPILSRVRSVTKFVGGVTPLEMVE
jgi:acetolactate synthase-1/2/3 large subunit